MNDSNYFYNKQLTEFLNEYSNRFKMIYHTNMPGKVGYQANLNRTDINAVIKVYLPDLFPNRPPIIYVYPSFNHEMLSPIGKVTENSLNLWNINSSLRDTITSILAKLEGKTKSDTSSLNQIIGDDPLDAELTKDLNSKSIEELILINFNPEDYISEFTRKQRESNMALLQEVSNLSETADKLKTQYEGIKVAIDDYRTQYEQKENELREVYSQKQILDSKFTVEKLIEEMKSNIDENYQKPRQKLINDFLSKKIDFETFKETFKDLSQKYHYYNIIKDKMNLYKIN